jgi:CRISPR/Cas system-associated exonuclease Cas4 (RecB family)
MTQTESLTTAERKEEPMTFEKVWEMFHAMNQESNRKFQEMSQELDRKMAETDRQIGRLGSRLGELIEHLTASNIIEKVNAEGYRFDHISRNHKIKDEKNKVLAEIDILLEDGDYAMVVEVKTNLTKTDVKEHLQRMDTLRRHADAHGDKRKYVSGVAGALLEEGVREYALKQGLYVIEHPGQTIEIIAPPQKREW